jgi:hypothetical protein
MTTLSKYRKCFDDCGVSLPGTLKWHPDGDVITMVPYQGFDGTYTCLIEIAPLCVCRCAAEDKLRDNDKQQVVLTKSVASGGAVSIIYIGDIFADNCRLLTFAESTIHDALIAALYRSVGKEVPSE